MYVMPISLNNNNNVFQSSRTDYITRKLREYSKRDTKIMSINGMDKVAAAIISGTITVAKADDILKANNITYCKPKDSTINIAAGYNGGYFTINAPASFSETRAKEFIAHSIRNNPIALGGLKNYMNMVQNVKRQDIIKKGLKIHTYELNINVPNDEKEIAAEKFSDKSGFEVKPNDLFFIEDEAFYYNKYQHKAYSIGMNTQLTVANPRIGICQFITDKNGNAIGYKTNAWDSYAGNSIDKEYIEQQAPSEKLPPVANPVNNKLFAESFRFGNSDLSHNYRLKTAIPQVKEHLSKHLKINNIDENDLQIVKFLDNDGNIQAIICYYDPTIGHSLVYSNLGKYMYQFEYPKDSNGNIIACSKF